MTASGGLSRLKSYDRIMDGLSWDQSTVRRYRRCGRHGATAAAEQIRRPDDG